MAWIVRIAKQAVFNLDTVWSIWVFHDRQSSIVSPRNFILILLVLIKIDSQFLYLVKTPKKGFCLICNSLYFWAHQHVDLDLCS
jgi:hypothetical protein